MKRFISFIICFMLVGINVKGADYDSHWANKAMDLLYSKNIIEKDVNGNLNPDSQIKRCEFVKVINRTFDYKDKAEVNFPDADKDKWYYDEFLIAKNKGYIKGDSNGFANPESNIKRAEVATVIARILNLKPTKEIHFKDENEIPKWAVPHINALSEKGIIKGYPDGNFKPMASMTRAEAFTVISGIIVREKEEDINNNNNNVNPGGISAVIPEANKRPSSGGGGGGGGGSANRRPKKIYSPIITKIDLDNDILYFNGVDNALKYEIVISADNFRETLNVRAEKQNKNYECDIKKQVENISKNIKDSKKEYSFKIKAYSENGYLDSDFSKIAKGEKSFKSIKTPVLTVRYGKDEGIKRAVIAWDKEENVKEYKISMKVEDKDYDYKDNGYFDSKYTEFVISDIDILKDKKCEIFVQAISEDLGKYKNSAVASSLVNTVSEETYIPIYSYKDFLGMKDNPTGSYVLKADITLPDTYVPFAFSGKLIGDNEDVLRKINVNIKGESRENGIFSQLIPTENVTEVRNIMVTGSVSTTAKSSYTGAIAGRIPYARSVNHLIISNCVNKADINGVTIVGGFVGYNSGTTNVTFEKLTNLGKVTGSENTYASDNGVGGISGLVTAGKILYCRNLGSICGETAGGILGKGTGEISYSYNKGEIKGKFAGGIRGKLSHNNAKTIDCYNAGKITSFLPMQAGGIAGTYDSNITKNKLVRCYNTGEVYNDKDLSDAFIIGGEDSTVFEVEDTYYLSEELKDDNIKNTTPLTSEDMKDPIKLQGFDFNKTWIINDLYIYPQLKGNEDTNGIFKEYDGAKNLTNTYEENNLKLNWENPKNPDVKEIKVKVVNNKRALEIFSETLNKDVTSVSVPVTDNGNYTAYVYVIYNDSYVSSVCLLEIKIGE